MVPTIVFHVQTLITRVYSLFPPLIFLLLDNSAHEGFPVVRTNIRDHQVLVTVLLLHVTTRDNTR